jgi:TPP-dependent pyruvate/acetoin dehydrogenase alpha subunit
MFEYWRKRDPIARFENYLVNVKKWLSPQEHQKLISEVESYLEQEREIAVNSPMPSPETAAGGVYCDDGCHQIKPKYGMPKRYAGTDSGSVRRKKESAIHFK